MFADLGQIVSHRRCRRRDVVLRQPRPVVIHGDRERLARRLLVPRNEVSAHHLIGQSVPFAVEANLHRDSRPCASTLLEDELMQQVIVLRSQRQLLRSLSVECDLHRSAQIGRAFFASQAAARVAP